MTYFSHSEFDKESGIKIGTKTIDIHTNGVIEKATNNFSRNLKFSFELDELYNILLNVCSFHDFGKFTIYFQDYLLGKKYDRELKKHARFGAILGYNFFVRKNQYAAWLCYYLIRHHHLDLSNPCYGNDNFFTDTTDDIKNNFLKKVDNVIPRINSIEKILDIESINDCLEFPDSDDILNFLEEEVLGQSNIQNYYLINYLFSLLIEADKLDASNTIPHTQNKIPINLVDNHIKKISNGKPDSKDLRNIVREKVLSNFDNKNILNERLFTLTAPTGVGKTLTSLDFALKLRAKLNNKPQIIYGLPFINIIEQAIRVYDDVIDSDQGKVLAHYQYADAIGQQDKYQNDNILNKNYEQKMKTLDCWQCDIVITTFVQLLQTLIGNRNRLLKRFNHFADSIIILDEVQTIKLGHQPLIGAALFYLTKFLNARIILMTATKPKIFELANHYLLKPDNEMAKPIELLQGYDEIFGVYHRTEIHTELLKIELKSEEKFLEQCFNKKWTKDKSCLIVCNLVKRSIDVFEKVKKEILDKKLANPVYYLSTNIAPCERLKVIKNVACELARNKNPILISTQSIEAGVDLDFDMGFRDLAPIDSIVQVAGRINRNDNKDKKYSSLFIVKFLNEKGKSDCQRVYDTITEQQSEKALKAVSNDYKNIIKEPQYLELVDSYYDLMTDVENPKISLSESFKFFDSMKKLKYNGDKKEFPVSAFKVIEDKCYAVSIFIELDDYSKEIANKFLKMLDKDETTFGREQFEPFKKDFHQRIIAVPKYLIKAELLISYTKRGDKDYYLTEDILRIPYEEIKNFYDLETGFIRDDMSNDGALTML